MKGWFSCNQECKNKYNEYLYSKSEFDVYKSEERQKLADAKGALGLFSEVGVAEARQLFDNRYCIL